MSKLKFPAIPEPRADLVALHTSVMALKENVEILTGQRGAPPVTWDDLVRLGVVNAADVPRGTVK